jgi:hypothetical protein
MKSKLQLIAKTTLALSLIIGLVNGWLIGQWSADASALKSKVTQSTESFKATQELSSRIATGLPAGTAAEPLTTLVADVLMRLPDAAQPLGVTFTKTPEPSELGLASEALPGMPLKVVELELSGTYKTYPELVTLLGKITEKPVAISKLTIQEHAVDVTLRVFGAAPAKS